MLSKKMYIPKGQRIYNFLKKKQSKKREVRAWSQEEACLNSNQAEGNVEALLLGYHNIHYLTLTPRISVFYAFQLNYKLAL